MLDPEAPEERREQIVGDAKRRIEAGGMLKDERTWGMRKLAYEIRQRTEADYRFFRLETEGPLLDELSHSLRIADGVLRFRIFKVDPSSPVIEPPPPLQMAPAGSGRPRRGGPPGGRGEGQGRPPRWEQSTRETPRTESSERSSATEGAPSEPSEPGASE